MSMSCRASTGCEVDPSGRWCKKRARKRPAMRPAIKDRAATAMTPSLEQDSEGGYVCRFVASCSGPDDMDSWGVTARDDGLLSVALCACLFARDGVSKRAKAVSAPDGPCSRCLPM